MVPEIMKNYSHSAVELVLASPPRGHLTWRRGGGRAGEVGGCGAGLVVTSA